MNQGEQEVLREVASHVKVIGEAVQRIAEILPPLLTNEPLTEEEDSVKEIALDWEKHTNNPAIDQLLKDQLETSRAIREKMLGAFGAPAASRNTLPQGRANE